MERVLVAAGPWSPEDAALVEVARQAELRLLVVSEARQAQVEIARALPAALLVDSALPGMGELLQGIRSSRELDLLPVIATVATATDADAVKAYTLGADDFILDSAIAEQLPPKLLAAIGDGTPASSPPMAHPVLLADGSELHRLVLARLLGQAGFQVTAVADGEQAIAEIEKTGWELLVFDLALPGADALEVLAKFRAKLGARTPQAIALTHVGVSDGTALRALTSGFRCVHDKRRPPEDLVFLANEARADAGKNVRSSPRLLCSTVVRWRSAHGPWELGLTHNLSLRGLYVRVIDPPPMGSSLELVLIPPGATGDVPIRARVAWRKDFSARAVRSYPTGMGLALEDPTAKALVVFEEAARILASGSGPIAVTRG